VVDTTPARDDGSREKTVTSSVVEALTFRGVGKHNTILWFIVMKPLTCLKKNSIYLADIGIFSAGGESPVIVQSVQRLTKQRLLRIQLASKTVVFID